LALLPLSLKAVKTQLKLKEVEPEVKKIKEKYKNDKQKQTMEMMNLYKEREIKPFSGFLPLLIQLPIIIALYFVFLKGGLPNIQTDFLYSFVPKPEHIDIMFLGLVNVTEKSLVVSIFAGLSQFVMALIISRKKDKNADINKKPSFKDELAKSFGTQMKYVFPFVVFFIAYKLSAAIAIYWTASNLFQILQELYVRKKTKADEKDNLEARSSNDDRRKRTKIYPVK